MKFSILVPVYNTEKYLKECVDSLINQTYKGDYEIILVNDGSTDNSGSLCDEYASKYPNLINVIHKENEGPFLTRIAGIKAANGDYCLFIDSDDFWELVLLERINGYIERFPEVDIISFLFNYYSENVKSPGYKSSLRSNFCYNKDNMKDIYESLVTSNELVSLCTKAIKTEILKKDKTDYSLYKDKFWGEDWFMSLYCINSAKKIAVTNEYLYNYRIINNSLTRSFSVDVLKQKNLLYVYERYKEYLPLWNLNDKEYIDKLNAMFFNHVFYMFCKFYQNSASYKQKNEIIKYDWSSMLPEASKQSLYNQYENPFYRQIYTCIKNQKSIILKTILFKKKLNDKIRKIKKYIKSKI